MRITGVNRCASVIANWSAAIGNVEAIFTHYRRSGKCLSKIGRLVDERNDLVQEARRGHALAPSKNAPSQNSMIIIHHLVGIFNLILQGREHIWYSPKMLSTFPKSTQNTFNSLKSETKFFFSFIFSNPSSFFVRIWRKVAYHDEEKRKKKTSIIINK